MRVFAYIARRYSSAGESTSLLSSVASLAIKVTGRFDKSLNVASTNIPFLPTV